MAKKKVTKSTGSTNKVAGKKNCPKCQQQHPTRHTGKCENANCDHEWKAKKKVNPYSKLKEEHITLILRLAQEYKKDDNFEVGKPKNAKPTSTDYRKANTKDLTELNKLFDQWELYEQFKIIPKSVRDAIQTVVTGK